MSAIDPKSLVRFGAIVMIAFLVGLFGFLGVIVWAALHLAGVL